MRKQVSTAVSWNLLLVFWKDWVVGFTSLTLKPKSVFSAVKEPEVKLSWYGYILWV